MTAVSDSAARELLAFYREAGIDAALAEAPANRFGDPASPETARSGAEERQPTSAPPKQTPAPAPPRRPLSVFAAEPAPVSPPAPPDAAVMAAREAAPRAAS